MKKKTRAAREAALILRGACCGNCRFTIHAEGPYWQQTRGGKTRPRQTAFTHHGTELREVVCYHKRVVWNERWRLATALCLMWEPLEDLLNPERGQ